MSVKLRTGRLEMSGRPSVFALGPPRESFPRQCDRGSQEPEDGYGVGEVFRARREVVVASLLPPVGGTTYGDEDQPHAGLLCHSLGVPDPCPGEPSGGGQALLHADLVMLARLSQALARA